MKYPSIKSAKAIDERTMLVEFSDNEIRKYDITPLLNRKIFEPLKNPVFFRNFRVDTGGYGIIWNEDIDISEYELRIHGIPISCPTDEILTLRS
jgi:hypothetical protein